MNSASVSWSTRTELPSPPSPWPPAAASTSGPGSTIQPSRSAGREALARRAQVDHAVRGRGPAARRPAGGRSGTRRRSRPPGSARRCARAQSTAAARRSGCSGTPVGNWWAGVSSTAATLRERGQLLGARAVFVDRQRHGAQPGRGSSRSRWKSRPYDSTATARPPRPRSTWPSRASAVAKPAQITIRSGSARTPRARAR